MKYRILLLFFFATCVFLRRNLRARLVTQGKSLHKFNLQLLVSPFGHCFIVKHLSFISGSPFSCFGSFLFKFVSFHFIPFHFLFFPLLNFAFLLTTFFPVLIWQFASQNKTNAHFFLSCFITKIHVRAWRVLRFDDVIIRRLKKAMTRKIQILTVCFISQRQQKDWQRRFSFLENETYSKRVSHFLSDPAHHWRS